MNFKMCAMWVFATAWGAQASPYWVHSQSVVEPTHLSVTKSVVSQGVSFNWAVKNTQAQTHHLTRALAFETSWNHVDSTLRLSGSMLSQLWRSGIWNGAWHVGASALTPVRGAADLGIGAATALLMGLGGDTFEVFFGPSIGADMFVREFGVRTNPRFHLGVRSRLGKFRASLATLGGVDLEARYFTTFRADAALSVGYIF